jgi:hypothetical protein
VRVEIRVSESLLHGVERTQEGPLEVEGGEGSMPLGAGKPLTCHGDSEDDAVRKGAGWHKREELAVGLARGALPEVAVGGEPGAMLGDARRLGDVGPAQVADGLAGGGELAEEVAPASEEVVLVRGVSQKELGSGDGDESGEGAALAIEDGTDRSVIGAKGKESQVPERGWGIAGVEEVAPPAAVAVAGQGGEGKGGPVDERSAVVAAEGDCGGDEGEGGRDGNGKPGREEQDSCHQPAPQYEALA